MIRADSATTRQPTTPESAMTVSLRSLPAEAAHAGLACSVHDDLVLRAFSYSGIARA
jgi:hypothetical protein